MFTPTDGLAARRSLLVDLRSGDAGCLPRNDGRSARTRVFHPDGVFERDSGQIDAIHGGGGHFRLNHAVRLDTVAG